MLCSLVICVFASFAIHTHCRNAPPCTDKNVYGPNKNCYFVYDEWAMLARTKKRIPNAENFGIGHLSEYRLAFGDNNAWYSTIVPTSGEDVWGYAFLTPTNEYEAFVDTGLGTAMRIIVVTLEVTKKDGTKVHAKCNAYALKNQPSIEDPVPEPLKPPADRVDDMLGIFKTVGIPADYRNKIKERFTKKC